MKTGQAKSFKNIFSQTEYMKIILANLVNRFGDSIDSVAFGWMVYQLTQSKTWLSIILGANMVPTIILQPLAGALVNYFDKKKAMVVCDVGRGLLVLSIAVLWIKNLLNPWILLVITISNSCLEAFRVPCSLSLVPIILSKENFSFGMSLNQGCSRISELIGLGVSGVIIATLGIGGAMIVDAVTFLLSAFILLFLKVQRQTADMPKSGYLEELKEGFVYFKQSKMLCTTVILCFFLSMILVPWNNLKAAFVSESLQLDAIGLSVGGFCMSAGLTIAIFLTPYITKCISSRDVFIYGGFFIGVLYLLLIATSYIDNNLLRLCVYGIVSFVYGGVNSIISLTLSVTFMSYVNPKYTGRVGGIFNAFATLSEPSATLLLVCFTPFLSVNSIYLGTTFLIFAIFGILPFTSGVKQMR